MKTIEQLLSCIEDDIELMGKKRIVYLMEVDQEVVDYDYLPSADYSEAQTLEDLQKELQKKLALNEREAASGKRLAVLFPGVGYTCDKPLLYYSGKLAESLGYELIRISYQNLPSGIKGDQQKKKEAFEIALSQVREQLQTIDFASYEDVLFISKSVGTIVSSAYARLCGLSVRNVLLTPVRETFAYAGSSSIAFHGLSDDWADSEELIQSAKDLNIPLFLTDDANHSLETGDLKKDLETLQTVLKEIEYFILK